ncbi:MAG TPA: hypothetical protein DCM86_19520 [Verrucomicrobiales bacterium]|nr:hypothetical protein [Verrucomicrobiales bacterium]
MISTDAAGLALSIAQGLIKLGGRLDLLLAERAAVTGEFAVPVPPVAAGPSMPVIRKELKAYLDSTEGTTPDPLGGDRKRLARLLDQSPAPDELGEFYARIFPRKASPPSIDPDQSYLRELRARMPALDWQDQATVDAAFYLAAGRDERGVGYPVRLGLLVADVLAEFGAENTARFVHDPRLAELVHAVVERIAQPDLESFTEWSPLLRQLLSSTLNGLLDERGLITGHNPWLDGVLVALAQARADSDAGDDLLAGLLQGEGYGLLVSEGLTVAARRLDDGDAPAFQQLVSDLLLAAAPLVRQNKRGFAGFFNEHWADLVRAALCSVEKHGPVLLAGENPLLKDLLLGLVQELAGAPGVQWVTREMGLRLVDAAIATVATHDSLWKPALRDPWLGELVEGVLGAISAQGIRRSFSATGLETLVTTTLSRCAEHPELLGLKPGFTLDLVTSVLKAVASAGPFHAANLATAALEAVLESLARHPALIGSPYSSAVTEICAAVAGRLKEGRLTGSVACDLMRTGIESLLKSPALLDAADGALAASVLDALCEGAEAAGPGLLSGAYLVEAAEGLLEVVAMHGLDLMANRSLKAFTTLVTGVVEEGLARAALQLGRGLSLRELPPMLAALLSSVARGTGSAPDRNDPAFQRLIQEALAPLIP